MVSVETITCYLLQAIEIICDPGKFCSISILYSVRMYVFVFVCCLHVRCL